MKRILAVILTIAALALIVSACAGPSEAELEESRALESAQARLAEAESESASIAESIAERANRTDNYTPTDEEKELICGDWYRSVKNDEGDTDMYWLSMDEKGYCKFYHETMNSADYIDQLEGTWEVDDHGFVNIDLGKYKGKFRFLKNAYGSTNIICLDGDDFVESGDEGAYAAFVPIKWYKGMLRFVEDSETEKSASDSKATASDATASEDGNKVIYVEMQGEGDSWFRLAAVEGQCKIDVDTREGENMCRLALNQNDYLVVKIQQIR